MAAGLGGLDTVHANGICHATNPVTYLPQSSRLLDQVSEVLRYRHYSLRTEQAYRYGVRFFVRWSRRRGSMRHPREMGAAEVTQFLPMRANERRVFPE